MCLCDSEFLHLKSYLLVLSVIIVNYNVKYFLEQCLYSVQKAMAGIEGEVIVFDNHSTDGSREFFQHGFPDVQFIWNGQNVGFSKANNEALSRAKGEYILFLNPDTIVAEDCFEKCISFIKNHNDSCAIGIRMIDGSGRFLKESKRAFPSPLTSFYKLSALAAMFPKSPVFSRYYLGHLPENEDHEVDVLAGAFMMLPRITLNKVKGFDEVFFMYGEDVDLSYRIQQAGYKNYYFSGSTIIHFKGESTKKGSLNYVKMFYSAMSIFVKKHYGSSKAGLYNFLIRSAIAFRAVLAGGARLLKWIGLPVIDALTIFASLWIVKIFWNTYVKTDTTYSPDVLMIGFPAFTLLFLILSYYSGLYDGAFRQSRLNRATLLASLVILTVYGLLTESVRFSRGILVFGVLLAFLIMSLLRQLLIIWKVIEPDRKSLTGQIVIAGTPEEFVQVVNIIGNDAVEKEILGRITIGKDKNDNAIGSWENLQKILKVNTIKELICCGGTLSYKSIIKELPHIPHGIKTGFFAAGGHSVIGSQDKNTAGEMKYGREYFRLQNPLYRRFKRLFDFCISLIFILTFPVHLIMKKNPGQFLGNCFKVLVNAKTFVGYGVNANNLPSLKPCVINSTGFSEKENVLPAPALHQADILYARNYNILTDMRLVLKNYQNLS